MKTFDIMNEHSSMKKIDQIAKMPFRVTLPRENAKYKIDYQQAVLNHYKGDKTVYSEKPFRLILSNGDRLSAGNGWL